MGIIAPTDNTVAVNYSIGEDPLIVVDKDNIAVLTLERFIGQIDQALGLSAALVTENNLNHGTSLLTLNIRGFIYYTTVCFKEQDP